MSQLITVEIPVSASTAHALTAVRRRDAVGRLVNRMVHPGADDPLTALLESTAATAGMTYAEIDAELTSYNAERRA